MAKNSPAFPFYAADFMGGVSSWSIDEVGIYIKLLCSQWIAGNIPSDINRLSRLVGCSVKEFQKKWPIISEKFVPDGKRNLINLRLEKIRIEQQEYRAKQAEFGKKGVEKRWPDRDKPDRLPDRLPDKVDDENLLQVSNTLHSSLFFNKLSKDNLSQAPPDDTLKVDELQKDEEPTNGDKPAMCPHTEIINLYHKILPELQRVGTIAGKYDWKGTRQESLTARWRESVSRQKLQWWEEYFVSIRGMPWLMGKIEKNGRYWKADLGWMLKYSNWVKIKEGRYVSE